MKRTLLVLVLIVALPGLAFAVRPQAEMLRPYLHATGPLAPPAPLAAPPQVGDTHTFWVWDMSGMPPDDKQIDATCRGVSDFGYVFVEDAQWNIAMNQDDVDAIVEAWDEATPAGSIDPSEGIYDIEAELYGDPPNVDGWPGVVLLYYSMGCFMGTCFDGFFRSIDEAAGANSNLMDMLHLEAVESDPGSEYMLGVTAHEFNHMIQFMYDPNEEMWLSEALAEAAMIVTGYDTDLAWLSDFVQNPSTTFWDDGMTVHYGAALLMGTYFYEAGGVDLLNAITQDPAHGDSSVETQLADLEIADTFAYFFGDLATAIAADFFTADKADDPYQFELLDIGELNWTDELTPGFDLQTIELAIEAGSLVAYRFDVEGPGGATVTFPEFEADDLQLGLISVSDSGVDVERRDVTSSDWPNTTFTLPEPSTVILVLANSTNASAETTAQVTFQPAAADDDAADDDVADDDATDDDATDDDATDDDANDDDATSGDDDDDSGCGC